MSLSDVNPSEPAKDTTGDAPTPNGAGIAGNSGLAQGISAGLRGEQITGQGLLQSVGGVLGIVEAVVPGLLYLTIFIITQDARVSVIAPTVLVVVMFAWRLIRKQTLVTALSGVFGVAVCVATTLFTGKGEDYFLPGFWINGVWSVALIISLAVGWPILGFVVGALNGNFTSWRGNPQIRKAATVLSLLWLALFVLRLVVQLPLYFEGNVAALGVARLVMGTPLFALLVLYSWLLFRNVASLERDTGK